MPAHTVVLAVVMLTVGAATGVTVMLTALLVATFGVAHAALLVITTVTASVFANVVELYEAELLPTLLPFNFHW